MKIIDKLRAAATLINNHTWLRGYEDKKRERIYEWLVVANHRREACWICGDPATPIHQLDIEHHHRTGLIRGLTCSRCNSAIELLRDDPEIAQRLALYLKVNIELMIHVSDDPKKFMNRPTLVIDYLRERLLATSDQEHAEAEQAESTDH